MASVNTNNSVLKGYEDTKSQMLNDVQNNYNTMVGQTDQKYNELIQSQKDYANTQTNIQQQKTDQTIAEINQNKDKVTNDYTKQQKAAYTDYAKQTNAYGVNAEQQAAAGLQNSGYSESSKVNLFNTYQNRVISAKEVFNQAILNYDNQITQAQIANSSALAEIAFNANQKQLELALQGFQFKNELLNTLTSQKLNISSQYDNLWQSQYKTLLDESQYNEEMAYKKQRDAVADSQWQKEFALQQAQFAASKAKSSSSRSSSGSSGTKLSTTQLSESSPKISENAQKLLNNIKKTTGSSSKLISGTAKALSRSYVYNQVQNNKITNDEADYIFREAGL